MHTDDTIRNLKSVRPKMITTFFLNKCVGEPTLEKTAWQKDGLTGKPNTRVFDSIRPSSKALLATSFEGQ